MKNRTTDSDTIGLEAWLEDTRIILPLRAVSVHADITAGFAEVAVDQLFEQNNTQPLDCRFLFPLPANAAAYRCEMHVNGRVILAKVEERAAARKHFKELKASGRRAALAESESDNLFTLQLGNIQPGDRILMRFAYLQPVQRLREQRTLRIPVNPGVRYIPGEPLLRDNSGPGTVDDTNLVPDASRITPPRIDPEHADAAALHATVRLHGAGDLADGASSPSHPIVIKRDGEDLVAALAANGHLPDCDFIFTWNEKPPVTPVIRTWLDENRRGLLEIRLPVASPSPATAVSSSSDPRHSPVTPQQREGGSQATRHNTSVPPDVYCLLDRSGSMQGANWAGACKALAAFVPRLHPDTRVWLTLFETGTRDYDAVPVRAGDIDFGPDGKRIHHHGTAGGTELVPALRHLGDKMREHSAGRSTVVLLITDGEVGNEHGAVSAAQQLGCPVHLLGVAMTANDGLDAIARSTGGRSVFLAPGEDIPAAVERFAPILRSPVVTGLRLTPGWQTVDESPLRNLCDGDDIVIPISASEDALDLDVGGHTADGSLWSVVPERQTFTNAGLLWARSRIRHLDASKRKDEALALAKEFNLLSRGAAFIAWDDSEKVPVAHTEIVQPAAQVSERTIRLCSAMSRSPLHVEEDSFGDYDAAPSPIRAARPRGKTSPPSRRRRKIDHSIGTIGSLLLIPVAIVNALLSRNWRKEPELSKLSPDIVQLLERLTKMVHLLFRDGSYPPTIARPLQRLERTVASLSQSPDPNSMPHDELVRTLEELLQSLQEYSAREEHELREKLLQLAELREVTARLALVVQKEIVRSEIEAAGAAL
jgi:Ca-activated chloride channel family protein